MEKIKKEKKLQGFLNGYKSLSYKKHDIILSAGHSPQYIFYIMKGIVNDYLLNSSGTSFTVDLLKADDFFPLFIFNDATNTYYFQASTSVEIKRIPKKELLTFLQLNPDILIDVSKKIATTAALIHDRLEHFLMSDCIEDRLQYLILQLAQRFGVVENGKTIIPMHLTHNDLASYIGVTRESVTRCLTMLVKKGILRIEKECITAVDITSLEQKF